MKQNKKTDKLNQTKPKGILHGECIIFQSQIPSDATPEVLTGEFTIIAPSETTGNHHVVDLHPGVEFFNKGGTRFFKNSKETSVRCVVADRHDEIKLPPGEYEIGMQQEYDYFEQAKRNVRD